MKASKIVVFISMLVIIALAACAPAAAPQTEAEPAAEEAAADQAGVFAMGCKGSAETALVDLDCRKIDIAVENVYLPFNYVSIETGEPGGWDYDAMDKICELLHCEPVFHEVSWDVLIQSVADGQYDMGADGVTITEDRKKSVDFSTGYVKIEQRLLVRKGETRFSSIEDIVADESLVLGTQTATTNYETAATYLPEDRIKAFETFPFAVQALISKDIDAVIIDQTAGMGYMGENAQDVELIGPAIESQELGFFYPKGSDLVDPINQAIAAMKADGSLDKIHVKFFGPDFKVTYDDIEE
jgi:polar amino acid transport system substrate-binding protein